jgi:anti-sigma regulatory factor (Ser/Thr protein kinase)
LRAYARDGKSPAPALEQLNALLREMQEGATATVWYGQYDPATQLLVFTNAGHVPPLVIGAGGAQYLDEVHGPPIGTVDGTRFDEGCCALEPGTTVLLYTDGLVERRDAPIDDGLAALQANVPSNATGLEQTCDAVLNALGASGSDDDVAVLAMRVHTPRPDLHITRRATPTSVPETRHLVKAWHADYGVDDTEAFEILVATTEACGNVVTHAYGLTPGLIEVTAHLTKSEVHITVADDGIWQTRTNDPDSSRGLSIMRSLMDHVEITTTPRTEVYMRRKLTGARHE